MDVTLGQCEKSESLAVLLWSFGATTRADERAFAIAERGGDPTRRIDPAALSSNFRAVLVDKVVGRDCGYLQVERSQSVRARIAARSAWTHTMTRDDVCILKIAAAWLGALADSEERQAEVEVDMDYHIEAAATRQAAEDAAHDTSSFITSAARAVVLQAMAACIAVARQLATVAAAECERVAHDAREASAAVAAKLHGLSEFILSPRIAQVGRAAS